MHRIIIAPRAQTHARHLLRASHAPIRRPPETTPKEADDMGHLKTLPPRVLGDQQRLTAKVEPLEDGCGRWRPPNAPAHFTPVCQASSQTPCNHQQPRLWVKKLVGARCQARPASAVVHPAAFQRSGSSPCSPSALRDFHFPFANENSSDLARMSLLPASQSICTW